ncbi:MAG: rRNA maturation RNase YbeY [Woeseiaceae bacterium]|nr:rRNA maturation RNase YbeY [Woeseiaceae bacterium]
MVAVVADVQVACDDPDIPAEKKIQTWVSVAVAQSGRAPETSVEVAVRVVDTDEIQTLNRLYRDKDSATNVLSFPAGDMDGLPADATRQLGDVVICASVVAAEAMEQGKALGDHWAHMIVHGTLHLLGFDHDTEAKASEMEALETRILASQSVTDPHAGSL